MSSAVEVSNQPVSFTHEFFFGLVTSYIGMVLFGVAETALELEFREAVERMSRIGFMMADPTYFQIDGFCKLSPCFYFHLFDSVFSIRLPSV